MCAKSITGRTQSTAGGDLDAVLQRAEVADAAHHLDAERHRASFLSRRSRSVQPGDHVVERLRAVAAEPEAGMDDDDLGAGSRGDARGTVERAERLLRLPLVGMAGEREERRVHGQRDVLLPCLRAEPLRPRVVHPEARLEVDLARRAAALDESRDGRFRRLARRDSSGAETKPSHSPNGMRWAPSDCVPTLKHMKKQPTRIDLLELDIDLRLTDLWREAAEVSEWNLEVVAAFMRAAYGKGYCDALTEDDPGSLCHEHGYRSPRAPPRRARRRLDPAIRPSTRPLRT